ncbi:MAG: hypothetical protein RIS61_1204 [Actinomycetota bacterium]
MGTLILIRHGRTPANEQGILAGRTPGVMLDEVGLKSTEALQKKFADLNVVKVVASPLERTVQTAKLVFPKHEPDTHHGLIECEYGDWTGRKLEDLKDEPLWKTVVKEPHKVQFPNGESMQAMFDRAVKTISEVDEQLTKEHGESFIWAAVSHGDIIKAIVANAFGLELAKFQKIYVEPASVSVLRIQGDDIGVLKVNDSGDGWVQSLAKLSEPTLGGQTGSEQK